MAENGKRGWRSTHARRKPQATSAPPPDVGRIACIGLSAGGANGWVQLQLYVVRRDGMEDAIGQSAISGHHC